MASGTGIKSIDVGCAMLGMHSIRETCGILDGAHYRDIFSSFYRNYENIQHDLLDHWKKIKKGNLSISIFIKTFLLDIFPPITKFICFSSSFFLFRLFFFFQSFDGWTNIFWGHIFWVFLWMKLIIGCYFF